jgi:hypothetical protein
MSKPPIRGTQSFVAIMGQVWRRPSLTALEIAWRWLAGLALFLSSGLATRIQTPNFQDRTALLSSLTVFQPVIAIHNITIVAADIFQGVAPLLLWLFPLAFLLWNLIAALGRTIVLSHLDPKLHARRLTLFLLGTLRALLLLGAWALWFWGLSYAAHTAITAPAARGEEPSLVLFAAMLICGTLALYVLWAFASWFLQLAPLLAMNDNLGPITALLAALRSPARGKLIEINLVMNIVRIALLVLAMVFSATPLPFSSVETQTFLTCWWIFVSLLWLVASDYFHVVRAAAYLSLHRALTQGS